MTWRTHVLFGISALWLLAPLPALVFAEERGILAIFAAFGSLLPDLDAYHSKINHLRVGNSHIRPFLPISAIIRRTSEHRGLLHSLIGLGLAAMLALPLAHPVGWIPILSLLLGYASHLLADAMTKTGISLLYPKRKRYFALPGNFLLTTGSQAEEIVAAGLLFPVIYFLVSL